MNPPLAIGSKRTAEMAAISMIGDGIPGLVQPERHVSLWRYRLTSVNALVFTFAGSSGRRWIYGLVQIAAGLMLAAFLAPTFTEGGEDA